MKHCGRTDPHTCWGRSTPALYAHIIFVETIKIPTLGVMHFFFFWDRVLPYTAQVGSNSQAWVPYPVLLISTPFLYSCNRHLQISIRESFSLLYSQLIFPRSDVVCDSWREEAVNGQGTMGICLLAFITLLELNHISPSSQFYFCASVSTFTCEFQVRVCHGMCGGQRTTFYLVYYWVCCASWATSAWDPPASHVAAEHFSMH